MIRALRTTRRVGINGHVYQPGTTLAQIIEADPDFPGGPDGPYVRELVKWLEPFEVQPAPEPEPKPEPEPDPPRQARRKKTTTRPARGISTRPDND